MERLQDLTSYLQKARYNGIPWVLSRIRERVLYKLFKYKDLTLIIYGVRLIEMPLLDAKIDVRYDWVTPADTPKILALNFIELNAERVEEYFQRGSRCYGAFLEERLIACSWVHFGRFDFPFYQYSIPLKDNEVYDGPDYVDPEFRGKRLHEAILTRLAAYFREKNIDFAYGSVVEDNIASHKGVKRAGVKPIYEVRVIKLSERILYKKIREYSVPE